MRSERATTGAIAMLQQDIQSMAPAKSVRPREGRSRQRRNVLLAVAFALALLVLGLWLRQWIFKAAAPFYFTHDMQNAWYWGSVTATNARQPGFHAVYKPGAPPFSLPLFWRRMQTVYQRTWHAPPSPAGYRLDYPPGRLMVVSLWAWMERLLHPHDPAWKAQRMGPLLWFNTVTELLAAAGLFFLVRQVVRRRYQPPHPPLPWRQRLAQLRRRIRHPWATAAPAAPPAPAPLTAAQQTRAWVLGLVAAAIYWFNPAVIQSAHTWVQYDVWVVPFYIWALFFAGSDCYFLAGAVLALGSVLKGQELFAAPMFLLVLLFAGRPSRVPLLLCGTVAAFGALVSPCWLTRAVDWWFIAGAVAAAAVTGAWVLLRRRWPAPAGWAVLAPAALAMAWPWVFGVVPLWRAAAVAPLAAWLLVAPWRLPPRRVWLHVATALALAFVAIALGLPASYAWLKTGYLFGITTGHSWHMLSLTNACGLGLILQSGFHWQLYSPVFTLPLPFAGPTVVTMRGLLMTLYIATMVLCAGAAAMHWRRHDPRFLIAMVTPWITFFAFAPQMYERYLIWGAVMLASVAVAADVGMVLMGLLLSLITISMTAAVQLGFNPNTYPKLRMLNSATEPGLAYAVVLAALVCLYISVAPGHRWWAAAAARQPVNPFDQAHGRMLSDAATN